MSDRALRAVVLSLTIACVSPACAEEPPAPVRAWMTGAFTPAVQEIRDPSLAPWSPGAAPPQAGGAGPAPPQPALDEMKTGCAEARRRLVAWKARLEAAPDRELRRAVRRYVADEDLRLDECVQSGAAPGRSRAYEQVLERLRQLGVRTPAG